MNFFFFFFLNIYLQSYMDSEIMAIMSQYMPLDNNHHNAEVHSEAQPFRHESSV